MALCDHERGTRTGLVSLLAMWIAIGTMAGTTASASGAETATVPLTTLKTKHVVVPVKINGKGPFRLVLDTGSPITFISNQAARRAGLLDAKAAQTPALLGMRGQIAARSFAVGSVPLSDFEVTVLDHPVIELLSHVDGPVDGIVGISFFGRFRTTIDYAAGKATFAPVDFQPQDVMRSLLNRLTQRGPDIRMQASGALWGVAVEKPDAAEGVRVAQVYAKSAAEAAGLRAGDRIMTIDGRWTDSIVETFEALAQVRPGQAAPVVVVREGRQITLTVQPRAGI